MSNLINTHAHTHTRTKANARKGTVLMGWRDAPEINFKKKTRKKKNEWMHGDRDSKHEQDKGTR